MLIREARPFTIASNNIKFCGVNVTKEVTWTINTACLKAEIEEKG